MEPDAPFQRLQQLGVGAYGTVFKGINTRTGEIVALKEIRCAPDKTVPLTAVRETFTLSRLRHINILRLHTVTRTKNAIVLVLDYMTYDLKTYISLRTSLDKSQVKSFASQLLEGVSFCHSSHILHRDLKPENLLVNDWGLLKIGDFGMAQVRCPNSVMSHHVVTLWYRAPELLYGSCVYDDTIDVWSVGCIIAEMATGRPLFNCQRAGDMLSYIFFILDGTLPNCSGPPRNLALVMPDMDYLGLELLSQLLCLNSAQRVSAKKALSHPWLSSGINDAAGFPTYCNVFGTGTVGQTAHETTDRPHTLTDGPFTASLTPGARPGSVSRSTAARPTVNEEDFVPSGDDNKSIKPTPDMPAV